MYTVGTVKPAIFAYHAPTTQDEVTALLAEAGPSGRVIAGGQSLVPMMNFRIASPEVLVDLSRVAGLDRIEVDAGGGLVVGASVTMTQALEAPESAGWPMLGEALRHVGHPQIRNRGTVCGSLAHHDPSAELPAVAVALDAELILRGAAVRRVPAGDFFVSYYETAIEPGEFVAAVRFPPRPPQGPDAGSSEPREGWGFSEFARKHGDFALVGAAATLATDGSVLTSARLVLLGVDERPRRVPEVEAALVGQPVGAPRESLLDEALAVLPELISPIDDSRAGAWYRRELAVQTGRDALTRAWERADG